ncbi:MAG: hypothetical protein Sv326_0612 [Candidatus Fermentimicrarchaeum limneticum]|uniref:Uncharacterized protein n=1 Tax=Fermentimicrarchaeum limneticum TaxID=2795018 RepID=A0A7D5XPQ8_FERL1|nr:MAG: hypothetical protein Sv326_0612 [Candidatus Fermentimicrarchaeum limneticum]
MKRRPTFLETLGVAFIGRVALDAVIFSLFYFTGEWFLGATLNDLADSILIFVLWIIWFFCEKYDERKEKMGKNTVEEPKPKEEKGKKQAEERRSREA